MDASGSKCPMGASRGPSTPFFRSTIFFSTFSKINHTRWLLQHSLLTVRAGRQKGGGTGGRAGRKAGSGNVSATALARLACKGVLFALGALPLALAFGDFF